MRIYDKKPDQESQEQQHKFSFLCKVSNKISEFLEFDIIGAAIGTL